MQERLSHTISIFHRWPDTNYALSLALLDVLTRIALDFHEVGRTLIIGDYWIGVESAAI